MFHYNTLGAQDKFGKFVLPCRTVPAGQKQPSTQERAPHWVCGLCWTLGHEGAQAGPQGSYTSPFSHCKAAEWGEQKENKGYSKAGVKVHVQEIDCVSVGVCVWHTTELLGPPADVDPSAVAVFSIGSNGCTETLTVPTWVTAKTQTIKQHGLFMSS